jgi:cobalt-zinc-cadmium efflux system outer membrane protein
LPLFGFNRDGVLRAQAALDASRARRDALELAVRNDVALALDQLATAREIADVYRTALVPQREAASAHTLEEVNFMLSGAFELLATRREQFTAYREYIDAVRDYWLARVELRRAAGARLPDDAEPTTTLDFAPAGEHP